MKKSVGELTISLLLLLLLLRAVTVEGAFVEHRLSMSLPGRIPPSTRRGCLAGLRKSSCEDRSRASQGMKGRLGHLRPRIWDSTTTTKSPTSLGASAKFKNFEEMLSSFEQVVVVNFHATWCGPCRLMKKELKDVRQLKGDDEVKICTVDAEQWPHVGARYNVGGLPTLLFFKNAQLLDRIEGVEKASEVIRRLDDMLSTTASNN